MFVIEICRLQIFVHFTVHSHYTFIYTNQHSLNESICKAFLSANRLVLRFIYWKPLGFFHQDLAHLCVQVWRQAAWDWTRSNRYNRHNHFEVGRLGLHQGDGHLWCARNLNWEKVFHPFCWLVGAKVDTFFFLVSNSLMYCIICVFIRFIMGIFFSNGV